MRCSVLEVSRMATDRLGSIVAFVRVAELGSFAKAAKALGISSSAVSKSVAGSRIGSSFGYSSGRRGR
jgi:predicted transcriptional regulator